MLFCMPFLDRNGRANKLLTSRFKANSNGSFGMRCNAIGIAMGNSSSLLGLAASMTICDDNKSILGANRQVIVATATTMDNIIHCKFTMQNEWQFMVFASRWVGWFLIAFMRLLQRVNKRSAKRFCLSRQTQCFLLNSNCICLLLLASAFAKDNHNDNDDAWLCNCNCNCIRLPRSLLESHPFVWFGLRQTNGICRIQDEIAIEA